MERREDIAFYLRLLFLPLLLVLTMVRAWGRSWAGLEGVHRRQEAIFQRMWDLLPADVQEAAASDDMDKIPEPAIRRFARVLGDYHNMRPLLGGARESDSKYHYRNALDAAHRRLRIAAAREAQAVEALGRPGEG